MQRSTALRRGLLLLGVAYFALWACAPILAGPPPAPMAEGKHVELGLSGSESVLLAPEVRGDCGGDVVDGDCAGPTAQLWFRYDKKHFGFDARLFGGFPTVFGVGAGLSYRVVDQEHLFVAPQLSAGAAYGSLGVPVGLSVAPDTWVVLTPALTTSFFAQARLSEALWHTSKRGLVVGGELSQGTAVIDSWNSGGTMPTFNVTAAFQLGFQL
ncbi:MAG: hypothetical protein H6738_22945 [Alphaproteobacteria bacterium]|nr:hypothetical protein [Alphaproteobacteria bacterium]MCB9699661.1 hypothetical protein [Alphaproteobacteria bacterium]